MTASRPWLGIPSRNGLIKSDHTSLALRRDTGLRALHDPGGAACRARLG
jgi:hypothetical protein